MNLQELMNPKLIVLAVAVIALIVAITWLYRRKRRVLLQACASVLDQSTDGLCNNMGPNEKPSRSWQIARSGLKSSRSTTLIRPSRNAFPANGAWCSLALSITPRGAVTEADELVCSLMKARGYPVADFDQRAADISVDHPRVVENYRSAHAIALRLGKGEASTEDLRGAMIYYRSLFEELVQAAPGKEREAA